MIKVLIFWDVYWRIWRKWLKKELSSIVDKYNPDFKIVNIDNISYWKWPIEKHILEFENLGFDVLTTWNHYFDNLNKIKDYIESGKSKVIRCANYRGNLVWEGYKIIEKNWKKILVIHLLWQAFMWINTDNPFLVAKNIIDNNIDKVDWIIIDFHKETTAEWYWLLHFLDGKASFIFGTHTHVQTNDDIIFPKWTWFLSDVWMNWPIFSVIWADYNSVESVFLNWYRNRAIEQSLDENYIVNWVFVEIDENWKCKNIEKIKIKWKI